VVLVDEYGRHLRMRRQARGLSQRALADRASVPQPTVAAVERGRRRATPAVRDALDTALRERPSAALARSTAEVRDVIARHGGTDPLVFGSVARDEDDLDSDLDLIVTLPEGADLLDALELVDELEAILGVHVDLASGRSDGPVMERARREAIPL
jgi:hypothetical protein